MTKKIFNKTAQEVASTPEKWVVKKLARPGEPTYDLVCDTLMQMLNNAENTRIKQAKLYKSADLRAISASCVYWAVLAIK